MPEYGLQVGSKNRPGTVREGTMGIIVHWPGPEPRATPGGIMKWWASEKRYGSAHDIIGRSGKLLQAMPIHEVAYHVGADSYTKLKGQLVGDDNPNWWFHGIETCVTDLKGTMTGDTWNALVQRCADLCERYGIDPFRGILSHYHIVGTVPHWGDYHCHQWFWDHPYELERLRWEVSSA